MKRLFELPFGVAKKLHKHVDHCSRALPVMGIVAGGQPMAESTMTGSTVQVLRPSQGSHVLDSEGLMRKDEVEVRHYDMKNGRAKLRASTQECRSEMHSLFPDLTWIRVRLRVNTDDAATWRYGLEIAGTQYALFCVRKGSKKQKIF
eukprot:934162-Amphidinium_carterae.1